MADTPPVEVECDLNFDPPNIIITFFGQQSFSVSGGVYELIKNQLGLPDIVCGGS